MIKRRVVYRWIFFFLLVGGFFCAPQLALMFRYRNDSYETIAAIPTHEYGVLFGAYVDDNGILADVTRERADAAAQLYHTGKIQTIFVSATERANRQASTIAVYLETKGVPAAALLIDEYGIDSGDTCRHFAQIAVKGTLITQSYHLPRAMFLCQKEGVEIVGIAVDKLGLLEKRGSNPLSIFVVRTSRFVRECGLTWLTLLGLYDRISDEAERINS